MVAKWPCKMKHYVQSEGWLSERWEWGIHVLNPWESQSVVVLLNTLVYFSQRSKKNPSQWSLPSSSFIAFYSLKATHLSSWPHWTQMVQPWDIFIQYGRVDISTSLSKLQWQGNNQNSDTLDNPGPQTTLDKLHFLWQFCCLSLPSASLQNLPFLILLKSLHVIILKTI